MAGAERGARAPRGSQYRQARQLAKRGIPVALELYRRWQSLTPEQRERYLRTAREYAGKAGDAYKRNRANSGRGQRFGRRS